MVLQEYLLVFAAIEETRRFARSTLEPRDMSWFLASAAFVFHVFPVYGAFLSLRLIQLPQEFFSPVQKDRSLQKLVFRVDSPHRSDRRALFRDTSPIVSH